MNDAFCIICDGPLSLNRIEGSEPPPRHYVGNECGADHFCLLTCTLGRGHDGPHEAAGSAGIYARWAE